MKKPSRFIYVISAGEFVKIGITNNVKFRSESIQTGCPLTISVDFVAESLREIDARRIEKEAHDHFGKQRVRGEWFSGHIKDEAVRFIATHKLRVNVADAAKIAKAYPMHRKGLVHGMAVYNHINSGKPDVECFLPLDVTAGLQSQWVFVATSEYRAKHIEREWIKNGAAASWLLDRFCIEQP